MIAAMGQLLCDKLLQGMLLLENCYGDSYYGLDCYGDNHYWYDYYGDDDKMT